jgi:hypothetical protein
VTTEEHVDRIRLSEWIAAMRADGMTLQAIADRLNEENVPAPRRGRWTPTGVGEELGLRPRPPDLAA